MLYVIILYKKAILDKFIHENDTSTMPVHPVHNK